MNPAKGILPLVKWLMRLAVVFFVFITFFNTLKGFEYKSIQFYVAVVYFIFAALLFIGGFMSKPGFTVFSGLMLFLVSVLKIIMLFSDGFDAVLAIYFLVATIALYFVAGGNKN